MYAFLQCNLAYVTLVLAVNLQVKPISSFELNLNGMFPSEIIDLDV